MRRIGGERTGPRAALRARARGGRWRPGTGRAGARRPLAGRREPEAQRTAPAGARAGGPSPRRRSARPPTTGPRTSRSSRAGAGRPGMAPPAARTGRSIRRSTPTHASTGRSTSPGPAATGPTRAARARPRQAAVPPGPATAPPGGAPAGPNPEPTSPPAEGGPAQAARAQAPGPEPLGRGRPGPSQAARRPARSRRATCPGPAHWRRPRGRRRPRSSPGARQRIGRGIVGAAEPRPRLGQPRSGLPIVARPDPARGAGLVPGWPGDLRNPRPADGLRPVPGPMHRGRRLERVDPAARRLRAAPAVAPPVVDRSLGRLGLLIVAVPLAGLLTSVSGGRPPSSGTAGLAGCRDERGLAGRRWAGPVGPHPAAGVALAYDEAVTRHHIASAISSAAQEYLLALRVMAVDGSKVTAAQVGRHLGVTTQAASEMFRRLAADGLVSQAGGRELVLTEAGRAAADAIFRRHALLEWLLTVGRSGWAGPSRTRRRLASRAPSRRASRPASTRCSATPRRVPTATRSMPPRPAGGRPGSRSTTVEAGQPGDDLPDHRGGRGGRRAPVVSRGASPHAGCRDQRPGPLGVARLADPRGPARPGDPRPASGGPDPGPAGRGRSGALPPACRRRPAPVSLEPPIGRTGPRGPRPDRPQPDRAAPHRHGPDGPVQLPLRPADRRHLRPAPRGHRRRALDRRRSSRTSSTACTGSGWTGTRVRAVAANPSAGPFGPYRQMQRLARYRAMQRSPPGRGQGLLLLLHRRPSSTPSARLGGRPPAAALQRPLRPPDRRPAGRLRGRGPPAGHPLPDRAGHRRLRRPGPGPRRDRRLGPRRRPGDRPRRRAPRSITSASSSTTRR